MKGVGRHDVTGDADISCLKYQQEVTNKPLKRVTISFRNHNYHEE